MSARNDDSSARPIRPIEVATMVLATAVASAIALGETEKSRNLVHSIDNAPIVADGNLMGAATDVVITLDRDLDPAVDGYHLATGGSIRVRLPKAFRDTGSPALADLFSSADCVPGNLKCTTAVMLRGWPQSPIPPRLPAKPAGAGKVVYSLSLEEAATLVFTAHVPIGPGQPLPRAVNPGIKQLHLILNGFRNPSPGRYPVQVEIQPDPNDPATRRRGTAKLVVLDRVKPSVSMTSAFAKRNPRHLRVGMGTEVPIDYLLWDAEGRPMDGVTLEPAGGGTMLTRRGDRTVGRITVQAPPGASGYGIRAEAASQTIKAPVLGAPAARLRVFVRAGDQPGRYHVEHRLNGARTQVSYVDVN